MKNESLSTQIRTSLPDDNSQHIDYVIKYVEENEKKEDEHECYRKYFLEQLEMENIIVKKIRFEKNDTENHVYLLLHCPMERLLKEADVINLEMQLKTVFI